MKILVTRAPNVKAIERNKDFVLLKDNAFCQEGPQWRDTHKQAEPFSVVAKVA